jgi:hypothetical protein
MTELIITELIITEETHQQYLDWVKQYQEKYATGDVDGFSFTGVCLLLEMNRCPFPNPDCTNCTPASDTAEVLYKDAKGIVLNPHKDAEVGITRNRRTLITQHALRSSLAVNPILETTVYDGSSDRNKQEVSITVGQY